MNPSIKSEFPPGGLVSGNRRERSIILNDRPLPPGLSTGQVPVLMLHSEEQNIMQEILVRNYHSDKGTIPRRIRIPECARFIRWINDPANLRLVSFFLAERHARTTPVVQDINLEGKVRYCHGFSRRERVTLYTLKHSEAQNARSVIKKSGDRSCAEE